MRTLPEPLPAQYYEQPTIELARSLLGKTLVHMSPEGTASGVITETEAYRGPVDRAAHSYQNRRTKRTEVMFGLPGRIYTYVMHTHCLLNVVSGGEEAPEAVLIRAVEPLEGIELIRERRGDRRPEFELTNGPGKLTKALGITQAYYGGVIYEPPLYIGEGTHVDDGEVAAGPRIGIPNTGEAREYPWRFWIRGNPYVSKPRHES
ncbi:DNA-3-methyladenine glycosylase [Alteribacter natronophilus]|uniref:DNA-3-methyladenine glycosylase n=1 Tax=Alteribacter natronophilus TaxID=2583810 RepID=UPI00110D38A6|nr:DNA-3-methyladenine glycosylase [Alteribacter natronophilus]TMW72061.1 DNA-3-methyladenine glycosylase [Alteribacter natronophilus]